MLLNRVRYLLYTCGVKCLVFRVKDWSKLYLWSMHSSLNKDYIYVNNFISDISIPSLYKNGYIYPPSVYDIFIDIDKYICIGKANIYTYNFRSHSALILEFDNKVYKSGNIYATPLKLKEEIVELW